MIKTSQTKTLGIMGTSGYNGKDREHCLAMRVNELGWTRGGGGYICLSATAVLYTKDVDEDPDDCSDSQYGENSICYAPEPWKPYEHLKFYAFTARWGDDQPERRMLLGPGLCIEVNSSWGVSFKEMEVARPLMKRVDAKLKQIAEERGECVDLLDYFVRTCEAAGIKAVAFHRSDLDGYYNYKWRDVVLPIAQAVAIIRSKLVAIGPPTNG